MLAITVVATTSDASTSAEGADSGDGGGPDGVPLDGCRSALAGYVERDGGGV